MLSWSNNLAYVVGLIVTDGNLSKDGRHLDITSKDLEQITTFESILKTKNKIGIKSSPSHRGRKYYRIQFSNVELYRFLVKIGLEPNKSKTIGKLSIPDEYFRDFLRGCFDGDGFTYSYWDKRWKSSFLFYTGFVSASFKYLDWMNESIYRLCDIKGNIKSSGKSAYQLMFAKKSSIMLMKNIYYCDKIPCLSRKKYKVVAALDIINRQAGMAKW